MTITLEIPDEQARRLKAQAAQRGQSVEDYLLSLAAHEDLPYEEWRARLKALPEFLPEQVPSLPDEALRRETMYRE